jgi:hypothetical protein
MNRSNILKLFDSLNKTERITRAEVWREDAKLRIAQKKLPLSGPPQDRIERKEVKSIDEYLAITEKIRAKCPPGFQLFFRGQTREHVLPDSDQIALLPSAARPGVTAWRPSRRLVKAYKSYFELFLRAHWRAFGLTKAASDVLTGDVSFVKLLVEAPITPLVEFRIRLSDRFWNWSTVKATWQHYGFPTLNLDVTWSPLVALFFATHQLGGTPFGVTESNKNCNTGVVYALFVPDTPNVYTSRKGKKGFPKRQISRPRYVSLFDLFLDNDTRPRRQAGALLTEASYYWSKEVSQLNIYSQYIRFAFDIPPSFCNADENREFFDPALPGRFFPGSSVDSLYSALMKTGTKSQIIRYSVSGRGQKDPAGRFEHIIRRKIILVGSEAAQCKQLIAHTWLGGYHPEVRTFKQTIALIKRPQECIDVVMCCEPTKAKAIKLGKRLNNAAQIAGRTVMISFSAYTLALAGLKKEFQPKVTVQTGDMFLPALTDTHDSDIAHQTGLLDNLLKVNSLRTRIWLSQSSLSEFMDWNSRVRSY